jgi:preflagellin peptidase FlaK
MSEMIEESLEGIRVLVSLIFLCYSSWSDYKTREVSNKVWILFAPLALALTMTELLLYRASDLFLYVTCFGLTAAFAIILFYAGGFGGADAKALMCLALAMPFYPEKLVMPVPVETSPITKNFFPISVFSNSVLFAAFTAIAMLFYNLIWRLRTHEELFEGDHKNESIGKKILVLITGYKVSVRKLKEKWHVYPMEDTEENWENKPKRKLIIMPKDEGRTEIVERIDAAVRSGAIPDRVWATPGLPMLIFILAGLIATLLFGDIVWTCIRIVL